MALTCETCKNNIFNVIDVSVDRSKFNSAATDYFFGAAITQLASHPLRLYVCTTCKQCKTFYQVTGQESSVITETDPINQQEDIVGP